MHLKKEILALKAMLDEKNQEVLGMENVIMDERKKQHEQYKQILQLENQRDAALRTSQKSFHQLDVKANNSFTLWRKHLN